MEAQRLLAHSTLPLLVEVDPESAGNLTAATAWTARNSAAIEALTAEAGVVLLRGFALRSPEAFRQIAAAHRPDLRAYVGGDSPRRQLEDKVYSSTEYPAHLEVRLHNELSYAGWSPDRVFFCCLVPAASGGETTIADGRAIFRAIPEEIRTRFTDRGVTYLQHLWDAEGTKGPGKSWQETFETDSRSAAESYLREAGMTFEWTGQGLRCCATHAAALAHPVTGEPCWHNQADQWHRDLPSPKDAVPGSPPPDAGPPPPEGLGNHVCFGDGTEIEVADLLAIREAATSCEVTFPWQSGDIMVIDNVAAMHGRKPFSGERRVVVAMA